MTRFRKVDVRMWRDQKFRSLTPIQPCGQGLWIYLLTCPETTNVPGCFTAGESGLAEALGWPLKSFRKAFAEVFTKGMAKADWGARFVFVPNAIRYNPPVSPNVVKGWKASWDELPECRLKAEAYNTIKTFLEGFGDAFLEAFVEAIPEAFPEGFGDAFALSGAGAGAGAGEREEEICGDEDITTSFDSVQASIPVEPLQKWDQPIQEVWSYYRVLHPRAPARLMATDKRYRLIRARLQEGWTVEQLKEAIDGCHVSEFHAGKNDAGKKYQSLELIMRDGGHVQRFIEELHGETEQDHAITG